MNTKRPVITPATDTTDAVMESDTSLRLRAQRAYDSLSVAGPSGAYEYFARSASGLVRDARAISPSPANVTVSILSTEGDGTATEALLNTVRAVLNAEDTRPVADRLTVQSARIVTWRLNAKLLLPRPESNLFWPRLNRRSGSGWLNRAYRSGRGVVRHCCRTSCTRRATRGDNRTHTEYGHQRHTGGAL